MYVSARNKKLLKVKPKQNSTTWSKKNVKKLTWNITLFFTSPHMIAAWEGRWVPDRYFRTPFDPGRLDSSNWSDMSKKRRDPTSRVVSRRCTKAELVTDSKWAIPVTTTWGFNFFISSIIKSDCRGASITVIVSSKESTVPVLY